MLIFKPTLVFKPKSILWASLNRKCRIVYFVKLFPLGGDTEYLEDMIATISMKVWKKR